MNTIKCPNCSALIDRIEELEKIHKISGEEFKKLETTARSLSDENFILRNHNPRIAELEWVKHLLLCAEKIIIERIPKFREYDVGDHITLALDRIEKKLPKKRKKERK